MKTILKNIICTNCGDKDSKYVKAMFDAGFDVHQIACRKCGQNAISADKVYK